jgi:hypothetical protein
MSRELQNLIEGLEESEGRILKNRDGSNASDTEEIREGAEVVYVPETSGMKKSSEPDRHIAMWFANRQQQLFDISIASTRSAATPGLSAALP